MICALQTSTSVSSTDIEGVIEEDDQTDAWHTQQAPYAAQSK